MAVPIIHDWEKYFTNPHEGLGSSYERIILNKLLLEVVQKYKLKTALETPSFGFTGVSGINLVALAKQGCSVSLEDHNQARLEKIEQLWQSLGLPLETRLNNGYEQLDYADNSFDLGFNFSAMWFTANISSFISEFCRVCSKAILICVPNRDGIGYKMQIKDYSKDKYPDLHPVHLDPNSIKHLMHKNGWQLQHENYIDCPPWPDIGMSKELFVGKLLKHDPPAEATAIAQAESVSILPYYRGEDDSFASRMLRYSFVERIAPRLFKRYWAHHYYLLFLKNPEPAR